MDAEAFVAWSLDPARTVEERYTVELLVEHGVTWWNSQHKMHGGRSLENAVALSRERKLNPAYEPRYGEADLRKAAETLPSVTTWHSPTGLGRPIRSLEPFRFWTTLESLSLPFDEPVELSPLADLPRLHKLEIGYPGVDRNNKSCADYTPLARCTALRELLLAFNLHWPDLTCIDTLTQLETLTLSGNLLALPQGAVFPAVRRGALYCLPLPARRLADLPSLPACEFLTLGGVEQLDGIERMPHLRNLTLCGAFQSFAPLVMLRELTCLTVAPTANHSVEGQPRDVSPLARLPKLQYFKIGPPHSVLDTPRDYSPLAEAPALRELIVQGCPPVEMEVAAIVAGLPPWDDVFLVPEPRPVLRLRMVVAKHQQIPRRVIEGMAPGDTRLPDIGLRECEGRWVGPYVQQFISRHIGYEEWGTAEANGLARSLHVTVESFDVVERLPEIVAALREAMARLRGEYRARLMIALKAKPPEPTPAQKQLEEQFQARRDEWEDEQRRRDDAEYLERLHQMELKKQQGEPIEPEDFSPAETEPYPIPPWVDDEEDQENDFSSEDEGEGGTAVKQKPDPPPSFLDDEHPLADHYRLLVWVTLNEVWVDPGQRGITVHLMQREPDVEVPDNVDRS